MLVLLLGLAVPANASLRHVEQPASSLAPATAPAQSAKPDGALESGPMDPPFVVRPADYQLTPSAPVLSMTLGYLRSPPPTPRRVSVTCLVYRTNGVPLNCFPSGIVGQPKTWEEFRQRTHAYLVQPSGTSQADEDELDLFRAATDRVLSSRLHADTAAAGQPFGRLMQFDVMISAADARPVETPGAPIAFSNVTVERGLDDKMLENLYPAAGMLSMTAARVSVPCNVSPDRTLSCGAIAQVQTLSGGPMPPWMRRYFILSSYQAASTVLLAAKAKDGSDVVGRSVTLNFRWQIPSGVDQRRRAFQPAALVRRNAMDMARRAQLKLAPVARLPREEALAMLTKLLLLPVQAPIGTQALFEDGIRSSFNKGGRTDSLEKRYPGYADAMAKAAGSAFARLDETMRTESAEIVRTDLSAASDLHLSELAAAAQPYLLLFDPVINRAAEQDRQNLADLVDSREGRAAADVNIRQMDHLAGLPGGKEAIDAFNKATEQVDGKWKGVEALLLCETRTALEKATVDFLMAHGSSGDARLVELSLKAKAASGACVN